jgi:16S rRNA (guanine527-N7)-methyltransferase
VLKDGLIELGFPVSLAQPLEAYIGQIELFNAAFGLVSYRTRNELVVKHILDSLAPLSLLRERLAADRPLHIADAGSGAGLPGIPLAIAAPQYRFTLIERGGKRASFLRQTAAALALANVDVLEADIAAAPERAFDAVCFRAFLPLDASLLKKLLRLLASGGFLAAWKGRREKIDAELACLTEIKSEVLPVTVPFLDEERNLVIIKKLNATNYTNFHE